MRYPARASQCPPRVAGTPGRAAAILAALLACAAASIASGETPVNPNTPTALSPSAIKTITAQFRRHGLADAPAKPDGALRLATYNIHELFDDADDAALTGRNDDMDRVMVPSRRDATAAAIIEIDADILALQEVESADAVAWFRDGYLADLGYTSIVSEDVGHGLGLEQAVLSRFPVIASQTWADRVIGEHPPLYRGKPNRYAGQPLTFRRSPLMVELAITEPTDAVDAATLPEAHRLTLLVVHFKTGEGSDAWRKAEGEALSQIVAELKAERPDRRIAIVGDFAVPAGEGHIAPVFGAGFRDAFTTPESAPSAPSAPSSSGSADADRIASGIDGGRACFVLLGPGVMPTPDGEPFVLGTVVPPPQIDREIGFRMPGFASDHYPVVVDLVR